MTWSYNKHKKKKSSTCMKRKRAPPYTQKNSSQFPNREWIIAQFSLNKHELHRNIPVKFLFLVEILMCVRYHQFKLQHARKQTLSAVIILIYFTL